MQDTAFFSIGADLDALAHNERGAEIIFGMTATIGPAPCDRCEARTSCAAGLACEDFRRYVEAGELQHQARKPSAGEFRRMFSGGRGSNQSATLHLDTRSELTANGSQSPTRKRKTTRKRRPADPGRLAAGRVARELRRRGLAYEAIGRELSRMGHRPARSSTWTRCAVLRLIREGKA
jgi:hypothetical protein